MLREGLTNDFLRAAKTGDLEQLKDCVERGVDVNCVADNKRYTALHKACSAGHVQCVKYLLERRANANACTEPTGLANVQWKLMISQSFKTQEVISIKGIASQSNITPLHLAAERGCADVVEAIIAQVSDVNKKTSTKFGGDTPLHWLVKDDSSLVHSVPDMKNIVKILQEHGANLDAENEDRNTALHLCAQNSHAEVAQVLLELGANPDVYDKDSTTPQKLAVLHGPEKRIAKVFENFKQTNDKHPVQSPESTPLSPTDLFVVSGVGVDPIQTDGSSSSQEVAQSVQAGNPGSPVNLTLNINQVQALVMGNNTTVTSPDFKNLPDVQDRRG